MTVRHDPGGKVRIRLPADIKGDAIFSPCGVMRYRLERWRGDRGQPYALWVGMNPSTADAEVNDPTVCREWGFTQRFGLDRMVKVNVSPYRATSPKDMSKALAELPFRDEHQHNLITITMLARRASIIVMAHGILPKAIRNHGENIYRGLQYLGAPLRCLGTTKDGWPRHPLYVSNATPLVEFEPSILQ